jgi:hypothetical protein
MIFSSIYYMGKCCKCYGGRGRWGTSCYDDPANCCRKKKQIKQTQGKNKKKLRKTKKYKKK